MIKKFILLFCTIVLFFGSLSFAEDIIIKVHIKEVIDGGFLKSDKVIVDIYANGKLYIEDKKIDLLLPEEIQEKAIKLLEKNKEYKFDILKNKENQILEFKESQNEEINN